MKKYDQLFVDIFTVLLLFGVLMDLIIIFVIAMIVWFGGMLWFISEMDRPKGGVVRENMIKTGKLGRITVGGKEISHLTGWNISTVNPVIPHPGEIYVPKNAVRLPVCLVCENPLELKKELSERTRATFFCKHCNTWKYYYYSDLKYKYFTKKEEKKSKTKKIEEIKNRHLEF